MPDNDLVSGLLEVVDQEAHAAPTPTPEKQTTKSEPEPTPEAPEPKEDKPAKTKDAEEESPFVGDEQDFSRTLPEKVADEPAPEPLKTDTDTKTDPGVEADWKVGLPPEPAPFAIPVPQPDENGNLDPVEYSNYIKEAAKYELRQEMHIQSVENKALDAAEKLLPDMKTNPAVRMMVQNARVASVINGQQIDAYEAAKQVAEALGISPEKIAAAKAEGVQSAKTSITVQKRSAVENGATKPQPNKAKDAQLDRRLARGDDSAFAELFAQFEQDGKI